MRRFRFRLEAVLRQRVMREEAALQAFAVVQGEMELSKARVTAAWQEYDHTVANRPTVIDVIAIAQREWYLDTLRARIEQEERIQEGIAARLEDARLALVEARQAREAIDRLRESEFNEYKRHIARLEQEVLDEIATLRHTRKAA